MKLGMTLGMKLWIVLALLAAPALAGGWVYPLPGEQDSAGRQVFPTSDGRRFMSALEREEYLRQNREVMMSARAAGAAARQAAEAAAEPPPGLRTIPLLPPPTTGDAHRDRLQERSAEQAHALRERQRLLQWKLGTGGRLDGARTRAAIAEAEADRARRTAAGIDRLRAGAAAARNTLGQSERRPIGPLIRIPRVVVD